ncbi:hypothetical protein EBR21_07695 [bacterium]|nr:hypothetical protein [bacterium]
MVNLDLLSKNAAALLPVNGVVDTVVIRLGRLLANRLLECGNPAAAELIVYEADDTPSHDESDLYLSQFDCHLVNNLRTLAALAALQSKYEMLEERLLGLLAQRARRELNTINEDPPLATRLAQEIEALLAISPARGPEAQDFAHFKGRFLAEMTQRCQELLLKNHLDWSDLIKADKPLPAEVLLRWSSRLAHAVATAGSIMHRLENFFGKDPIEDAGRKGGLNYRQIIKQKHRPLHRVMNLGATASRPQTRRWEDESAQLMTERNFHAFAVCVDQVVAQLSSRLDVWSKNEIQRSAKPKPRLVEVENFFYADSMRRSLHQLGETLEDALMCAEKLLDYCHESGVAAAELIDDEIWSLYPKINRDTLKQARLRVRHSDDHFPLSVAHREWITRLSELALPAKA